MVSGHRLGAQLPHAPAVLSLCVLGCAYQLLSKGTSSDRKPWHAGEYNLRLGIMKEVRPEMVATYQGTLPAC